MQYLYRAYQAFPCYTTFPLPVIFAKTMSTIFKFAVFIGLLITNIFQVSFSSVISTGDFNKDFSVTWSPSHVYTTADGRTRSLKLDQESGSGFASNQMFLFGQIDMQIKLVPGHSAGTVVAFYLTSDQPKRDEIDFEFLGNVSGQPYILQTNVYADGNDDREERIYLWFDPTKNFHTYSVLWNLHQIVFMVDWIPIRLYRNHADKGVAYPRWQPMSIKTSLWNGDSWATRGKEMICGKDEVPMLLEVKTQDFNFDGRTIIVTSYSRPDAKVLTC
ncbi:hypothetical protein SADUNF_Sadunf09G0067400 [Salix dunnii]|uniref:GH16 domain-containing protein n=1 Tax=Salix dunnii TaxID=1413687 RepID=A0A835MS97_9ROSI|nr:hypothetical protein SADUNF_Sadunf09G0067400 [Salix dunnii]